LVSVRWIINGDTSAEHDLVTLSGSSNNKRVVNHQRSVNLIAGVNNISLQIKRTGIGTITLFNSLGIITSSRDEFGDQLDFKEIDVNTTCLGVGSFTSCGTPPIYFEI